MEKPHVQLPASAPVRVLTELLRRKLRTNAVHMYAADDDNHNSAQREPLSLDAELGSVSSVRSDDGELVLWYAVANAPAA